MPLPLVHFTDPRKGTLEQTSPTYQAAAKLLSPCPFPASCLCLAPQEVDGALRTAQHEAGGTDKVEAVTLRQLPYFFGIEAQRVFRGAALRFRQLPVLGMPLIARHMIVMARHHVAGKISPPV